MMNPVRKQRKNLPCIFYHIKSRTRNAKISRSNSISIYRRLISLRSISIIKQENLY